jgi:hypothetical protein
MPDDRQQRYRARHRMIARKNAHRPGLPPQEGWSEPHRRISMAKHLYLRKANDDFVSHCKCDKADALIASPGQMDCPWCGCGWLFICSRCRKAFTFAEVVEVDESWEEMADRTLRNLYQREPEPGDAEEWIGFMKILLKDIRPGDQYVYFDGWVVPTTAERINFEGWHSRHDLEFVPHVCALHDPEVCTGLLSSREYWESTMPEREDHHD